MGWIPRRQDRAATHRCSTGDNSIPRPVRDGRVYGARASPPGTADRCNGPPETPSRFPPRALRAFPTPKAGACFSGLIAARRPCVVAHLIGGVRRREVAEKGDGSRVVQHRAVRLPKHASAGGLVTCVRDGPDLTGGAVQNEALYQQP